MLRSNFRSRRLFALTQASPIALMRSITAIALLLFAVLGATASHATSYSWIPLDHPQGAGGTELYDIDGTNVVGAYTDSSGRQHGAFYDGSTWTTLDPPGWSGTWLTLEGIDGANIVGTVNRSDGTLYNGSTWTTHNFPGAVLTFLTGIDGTSMVGYYSVDPHGIIPQGAYYDGSSWNTLNGPGVPESGSTFLSDIDGTNIVGYYHNSSYMLQAGVYDGSTWTTYNFPGGDQTWFSGIDGTNFVGTYVDSSGNNHGVLYNGSAWTTLDYPGATDTELVAIDGNRIIGQYQDGSSNYHGFMVTIPEPSTALLLGIGLVGLGMRRQTRRGC